MYGKSLGTTHYLNTLIIYSSNLPFKKADPNCEFPNTPPSLHLPASTISTKINLYCASHCHQNYREMFLIIKK